MPRTSRRRFLGAVGAAAVAAAGCAAPSPGRSLDDRPTSAATEADATFRAGLGRHGRREATIPADPEVAWRVPDVNPGEHTAAKASFVRAPTGDLVVPGDDGVVRAVSPDGEVRWTASTNARGRGIHGTPTVANGLVYVGAYDGALYAVDLDTGRRRFRVDLGDAIGSSPAYHDGVVYIAVEYNDPSGALFAVDALSGDVLWDDQRVTDHPHSTTAIDLEAGQVVVGSNDGYAYAWSYPDMAFDWKFRTEGAIKGPVATYDGAAFFGSWDNRVYRVDLATGTEDWSFAADNDVMTGPAVDDRTDTVYVGSHDRTLYALDAATGESRWAFPTGGWLVGCPTVTDEHVLVGSYDGNCYAVDRETGRETWRVALSGWVTCAPLVHDGRVYVTERAPDPHVEPGDAYCIGPA